jgi:HTH-type transcriptional regulator, sugar sensing transcriptional regulator
MATVDLLQQIGLNKYEAEAYYALLIRGSLTGYEVGKYSQVPGSRSYEILERLLEKGLALVQPGDPPRYSAQDPRAVFERFRSTMETTLTTLATSLASLAPADRMGEFWVVRGEQNILALARDMIANAQESLDLKLPLDCDIVESLSQANARGCRVFRTSTDNRDSNSILLVRDGREALAGTLSALDSCQAVVSSNAALLDALHGYFQYRRSPGKAVSEIPARSSQPHEVDWMDWEARKQRHLRSISAGNRVA